MSRRSVRAPIFEHLNGARQATMTCNVDPEFRERWLQAFGSERGVHSEEMRRALYAHLKKRERAAR